MTSFDISPGGVKTVLTNVASQAETLQSSFDEEAVVGHVGDVLGVPAPGVAQALGEYFDLEKPVITSMFTRIEACLLGASNVTAAYGTASDEMLADTQSRAVDAAVSGDFSTFDTGQ
jgi:hypothetical protein